MSVDFHIARAGSVDTVLLARRLSVLLVDFLDVPMSVIHVLSNSVDPKEVDVRPAPARLENEERILRVTVAHLAKVHAMYFPYDAPRKVGNVSSPGTYLIALSASRRAPEVFLASLVAEAICEMGGLSINDEGFLTGRSEPVQCGVLLDALRTIAKGRAIVAEARSVFLRSQNGEM